MGKRARNNRGQYASRVLVPQAEALKPGAASGGFSAPGAHGSGDDVSQDRPDERLIRAEDLAHYVPGPKGPKWTEQDEADRNAALKAEADEIAATDDRTRAALARGYAAGAKRARAVAKTEAAAKRKAAQRARQRIASSEIWSKQRSAKLAALAASVPDPPVDERTTVGSWVFVSRSRTDEDGNAYGGGKALGMGGLDDVPGYLPLRRTTGQPTGRPPSPETRYERYQDEKKVRRLKAEWPSLEPLLSAPQARAWTLVKLEDIGSHRQAGDAMVPPISQQRVSQLIAEVEAIRKARCD